MSKRNTTVHQVRQRAYAITGMRFCGGCNQYAPAADGTIKTTNTRSGQKIVRFVCKTCHARASHTWLGKQS
jgi:cytochrome c5